MKKSTRSPGDMGGSYLYAHPVDNLIFCGRRSRLAIGDCVVATKRSTIHTLRSEIGGGRMSSDVKNARALDSPTIIVSSIHGKPKAIKANAQHRCREALWVLAGVMMFFAPRSKLRQFGLRGDVSETSSIGMFIGRSNLTITQGWQRAGSVIPVNLDARWWAYFRDERVAKVLSTWDDRAISTKWKQSLWRAITLMGRSWTSRSRAEAFLYQMFALDALLLSRGDIQRATLTRRLRGLLHDHANPQHVELLYSARCDVVHDAKYSAVTPETLHLADYYAFNTVMIACRHRTLWRNKQEFLQFCSSRAKLNRPAPKRHGLRIVRKPFRADNYEHLLP